MKPHKRVIVGRNITLAAGALYALSRSVYYATLNPHATTPAQGIITGDGALLLAWAGVWGLASAFCIADMINRHTRHGLSMVVGLAFGWGVGYLVMWAFTWFSDFSLLSSAVSWLTPAALVFGFLLKVTALQDMLRSQPKKETA
jgi:hypothetical protein